LITDQPVQPLTCGNAGPFSGKQKAARLKVCVQEGGKSMNHVTAAGDCGTTVRKVRSQLRRVSGGLALSLLLAATSAGAQDTSPSGTGGVTGDQIKQVLGLEGKDAKALGTGLHFKLGIVLALTGPGSYYGRIQGNGAKLAVAQIKAAGGPDIELIFKDHKTADAQAGARATRELGIDGVPALLSSFVGDIGAMFPGVAQYKMLTLDGCGGTSISASASRISGACARSSRMMISSAR
jgi:Periplasmic binding protein